MSCVRVKAKRAGEEDGIWVRYRVGGPGQEDEEWSEAREHPVCEMRTSFGVRHRACERETRPSLARSFRAILGSERA